MTHYDLFDLNQRAKSDPEGLIHASEMRYHLSVESVADQLAAHQKSSPIALVCGPSSSGKTTTTDRLRRVLEKKHGIHTETVSMDDYYRTNGTYEMPYDEENGVLDLESPLCMDLPLLGSHLRKLAAGETIAVPRFDFVTRRSVPQCKEISLEPDEIVIIEGIHAFSDLVAADLGERAVCVYLSVDSTLHLPNGQVLTPDLLRFMRRAVRDMNFRNEPIEGTIRQWKSVRRGERLYIEPNLHRSDMSIDSYLAYETFLLSRVLEERLQTHREALEKAHLEQLLQAMGQFEPLEYLPYIPEDSVLHEFIG